jgi:hypothetical protein
MPPDSCSIAGGHALTRYREQRLGSRKFSYLFDSEGAHEDLAPGGQIEELIH